jgi:hypothetical protein
VLFVVSAVWGRLVFCRGVEFFIDPERANLSNESQTVKLQSIAWDCEKCLGS